MTDLAVTAIRAVYYYKTDCWQMRTPVERSTNGIVLFTEGRIRYRFSDSVMEAGAGDFLLLPKGIHYFGESISPKNAFYVIDFDTTNPAGLRALNLPTVFPAPDLDQHIESFRELCRLSRPIGEAAPLMLRAALYRLLGGLVSAQNPPDDRLARMIGYFEEHFSDPACSPSRCAEAFSVSESQLRRIFTARLGIPPVNYLQNLRLGKAKLMLTQETVPIGEIAERCGFSSAFYFSRLFRERFGTTPSRYAISNRAGVME